MIFGDGVYPEKIRGEVNVIVEKSNRNIEFKSTATSRRGVLLGLKALISNIRKKGETLSLIEIERILDAAIEKDTEIKNNTKATVKLAGWKGKSSLEIMEQPNSFKVITFQRKDQDSEPESQEHIITKEEVNFVIGAINLVNKEIIDTKDIAEKYCILKQLKFTREDKPLFNPDFDFKVFFSDRSYHLNLNLILRLLDHYGFINYRAGKIKILRKVVDIQVDLL